MLIGIPQESLQGETRVAATPDTVAKLIKLGFEVAVQSGAGALASFTDEAYEAAGAKVVDKVDPAKPKAKKTHDVWASDIIFKVNAPDDKEIELLHEGQTLVSFIRPAQNPDLVEKLNAKKVNVLAMDMVPRISRAQSLDALSSMANISGYRAVIEAAHTFGRFFTGQVTAAGKVPPAKVLVIGAGTIGALAAVAAKTQGATVYISDVAQKKIDYAVTSFGLDGGIFNDEHMQEKCAEVTQGHGFDVTIEAVGLPSTFQAAIDAAAFGGRVVLIGVGKKNLDFNFTLLQKKELNVYGSRNALKQDFLNLIDLVSAGKVDLKKAITNTYALKDAAQAFKDFAEHGADMLKVEIDFRK